MSNNEPSFTPSPPTVSNNEPSFIRSSTSLVNSSNELDVYEEMNSYIDRESTKIRRTKSVDILDEMDQGEGGAAKVGPKPRSRSNSVIGLGGRALLPGGLSPSTASIINDPLHEGLVYVSPGVSPGISPSESPRDSPVTDTPPQNNWLLQPRLLARLQKGGSLFSFRGNKKAG